MRSRSLQRVELDSFSIGLMVELLTEAGIDPDPALARCGLTRAALDEADRLITGPQELDFQRAFVELTRSRVDLWITLATRYRPHSLNPWAFALLTAPSVGRVFELITEFTDLSYSLADAVESAVDAATRCLVLTDGDTPQELLAFSRCRDVVALTNLFHDNVWSGRFPFIRIETPLPASDFANFDFRAPVVFEADRTAWLWPSALAKAAPRLCDPALHRAYLEKARGRLRDALPGDPLVARIHAELEKDLRHGSVGEMATHLGLTERALQRRLAKAGLSLRDILDRRRRARAEGMLLRTHTSIGEIADQLGYSDQATFTRAFKRWTGISPSLFRRRNR